MIKRNVNLSEKTTYKFGGLANYYLELKKGTEEELAKCRNLTNDIYILGNGSNIAFSDKGYPGMIIKSANNHIKLLPDNKLEVYSGTSMPDIARFCYQNSLKGAEFMIGIPGTIGGGVLMNAGAYGASTADILSEVFSYNLVISREKIFKKEDLKFGYRTTEGLDGEFVYKVHLNIEPDDKKSIQLKQKEYLEHRKKTQPSGIYNAGSVFKNPKGLHSGELIERAGMKGYRLGTVSISEKHGNFFVADKNAKAIDLYNLVLHVKKVVYQKFAINLEEEIRFVGNFG